MLIQHSYEITSYMSRHTVFTVCRYHLIYLKNAVQFDMCKPLLRLKLSLKWSGVFLCEKGKKPQKAGTLIL